MKKLIKGVSVLVGVFIAFNILAAGFSTFDYGSRCTKCLRDSHVVEYQFFGIPFGKSSKLRFEGYDLKPVLGKSCEHVFRKGGFGRSFGGLFGGGIGCGITGEGGLFRFRWDALSSAFDLNERVNRNDLMRKTFEIVDSLLPSDATTAYYRIANQDGALMRLSQFSQTMEAAKTSSDWEKALTSVKNTSEQGAAANP